MVRTLLYHIAGIDRETLATCPATDRMWAAQLGFSLVLSFTVVLGITFHASGYILDEVWERLLVATVVALTVFMFDRALYQSDWFYQGLLWLPAGGRDPEARTGPWTSLRRFCRITIRLSMSFGLAWVIAVFLELAVFSDTITDKIKRDHVAINQPIFQKIGQYEAQLGAEIEQRRQHLSELEQFYGRELTALTAVTGSDEHGQQLRALDEQITHLDAREEGLRTELRHADAKIASHAEAMNAEELGQRINPASSGRAGAGPRYEFARRQKEFHEARRAELQSEMSQLGAKREELMTQQRRLSEQHAAQRDQSRDAARNRQSALAAQIDVARTELRTLEAARLANIEDFRRKALAASDFQKEKNDPLSRMTAYQELKNDPKDGSTITLFSWMTKFLVIFLEIVPIVAKMFFSPPSVYAAKIQTQVERERRRAMLDNQQALVELQSELDRLEHRQAAVGRQVGADWREDEHGLVHWPPQADRRPENQRARVDRMPAERSQPAHQQPLVDRQSSADKRPEDQHVRVRHSGNGRWIPVSAARPKEGILPKVPENPSADATADVGRPSRNIDAQADRQANEVPAPADEPMARTRMPEAEGPAFDALDPQVQDDWDELMEAAERGDFRTTYEKEELAFDIGEYARPRPAPGE
jgi:hypothetical protein